MAHIKVLYQGQTIAELELHSGHEYIAGRSANANIVLNQERAISRQHLKFIEENGIWRVTLLSKIGSLITSGQSVDSLALDNDMHFSVPPYEFIFEIAPRASATMDASEVEAAPVSETQALAPITSSHHEAETPAPGATSSYVTKQSDTSPGNLDATRAGASALLAFLKITNSSNGNEETLKLEGHVWTVGRSPSAEIYINDSSISRKHFELSKTSQGYFVTDFDSSNGTTINSERIAANHPYPVRSGDVITIRNIQIIFEVRNTQFDKMMQNLPAIAEPAYDDGGSKEYEQEVGDDVPMRQATALIAAPSGYDGPSGPGVIRMPAPVKGKKLFQDKRITIAMAVLLLGTAYYFSQPAEKPPVAQGQEELGSQKEVTPQQMSVVKEKYELAKKNYYERGNYTFCRDLLYETHQIVPFYEDSKNLLALCEQSIELQLIRAEREQKEKKKLEAEMKIKSTVENCRALQSPTMTVSAMQECLGPAFELDPQNADGLALVSEIENREAQVKMKADEAKDAASRIQVGKNHYNRALQLENSGKVKAALNEYQSFISRSYPGMSNEVANARRSIASIEKSIEEKISAKLASCKSLVTEGKMKDGIKACDVVLAEDSSNSSARELREQAKSILQKELRAVYEDSRLEESMGNVEGAKQKWLKIKQDSYPGEEFYEKAKSKIKKYEG